MAKIDKSLFYVWALIFLLLSITLIIMFNNEENITSTLVQKDIEIFYDPLCSWCQRTLTFFEHTGLLYFEFDISEEENFNELIRRVGQFEGVPVVFIDGEPILGYQKDLFIERLKD